MASVSSLTPNTPATEVGPPPNPPGHVLMTEGERERMERRETTDDLNHVFWLSKQMKSPLLNLDEAYIGKLHVHDQNPMMFVEEIATDYSLLPIYISQQDEYSEQSCRELFQAIALVVKRLHDQHAVHRTLHLNNVVVHPTTNLLKLRGFQKSHVLVPNQVGIYETDKACDVYHKYDWFAFRAPELDAKQPHGKAVDIWSLGAMLYMMSTGVPPFRGSGRTLRKNKRDAYICNDITAPSEDLQDLISKMLKPDPLDRITIDQVLDHPWMLDDSDADFSLAKTIFMDWSRKRERRRNRRHRSSP